MQSNTIDSRLEDFDWSVRAQNVFRANSITKISELLAMSDDELLALTNFGQKTLQEVNAFKADWEQRTPKVATGRSLTKTIPESILQLDISTLHLGQKEIRFREAGIGTIGQCRDQKLLRRVPSVGRRTLNLLKGRLEAVERCIGGDEKLDLDRYCEVCGIPLLPIDQEARTGQEFLEAIPIVFNQIAGHLPDPFFVEILQERLLKGPTEKKTLEEIATTVGDRITRERVRQKEKKLLQQFVGALVWDEYADLKLHFRPSFVKWWRAAAEFLIGREDIDFDEFVSGLCEIWNVDAGQLVNDLPIILAIVTGEGRMPDGFRAATRLDHRLYGDLPYKTLTLPLSRLRLGKHAAYLDKLGFSTLGEFIEATRIGLLDQIEGRATRKTLAHLRMVARCLDGQGYINWDKYRETLELVPIPTTSPKSPAEFLANLETNIFRVIEAVEPTKRSKEVFRLRTSRSPENRLTLAQVAARLGTVGPLIKREENLMLQRLNDLFVLKDFSDVQIWLDASWLECWQTVVHAHEENPKDTNIFAKKLAVQWSISYETVNDAIPILWAILTGYPKGRPRQKVRMIEMPAPASPQKIGRIKLRGFRRFH